MGREDDDAVGLGHLVGGPVDASVELAVELDLVDPRVAVAHLAAAQLELAQDLEPGRLADVVNVGLVRHAHEEQARVADGLAGLVQGVRHPGHHVRGHVGVDLVRRLDQLRRVAVLAQAPGEEVGDDRDAVATETRAGVVGEEPERLAAGRLNHLPGRDAELVAHQRQLVGERDVHGAEGVLVQLGGLRDHRARHRDHLVHGLAVEQLGAAQALLGDAGHELGGVADRVLLVARVHPLGRVAEEEVLADLLAAALQDRQHDLLGGAGVRRGLEHDELARPQVGRHRLGRRHDVGDVRRARLRQRRGHADRDRVELADHPVVRGGGEAAVEVVEALGRDVHQVRALLADRAHSLLVDVDAGHGEARLGEHHRQGQAGIAEAHDADRRLTRRNAVVEGLS